MDNFNENYGRATEDELLEMRLRLQESEIFEARLKEEAIREKQATDAAKRMLGAGMPVSEIAYFQGMTIREVEKLKEKL